MKKLSFLAALLPLLFCACSSFIEENSAPIIPAISDLQAGFADETRTYVENGRYLRWHEEDRLTAFYGNTLNRQYKFKGKTGDNSGSFAHVPSGDLETGNAFDRIYALYSYNETTTITDEGEISLTLPALQSYAENSFGRGANTMIAVTENLEDTFLAFKNACGYLKLKLYNADGVTIKSIEVKGNNGEKIAGAATATIAFGEAPVLLMADDATDTITIDCGDGISLGTTNETATEFWVVIPQTTFTKGITITITDSQGGIFEKSTDNEVAITRNTIQPMAAVEFVKPQPNNEIWYTTTDKQPIDLDAQVDGSTMFSINAFEGNVVSNNYINDKGVIIFDKPITKIGGRDMVPAFQHYETLESLAIPEGVVDIADRSFVNLPALETLSLPSTLNLSSSSFSDISSGVLFRCPALREINGYFATDDGRAWIQDDVMYIFASAGLTSYTVPEEVKELGDDLFHECKNLTSLTLPNGLLVIGDSSIRFCTGLTTLDIPETVHTIGSCAISFCELLLELVIPFGVTRLEHDSLSGNSSLISITLPEGLTYIADYVFDRLPQLNKITIPSTVKSIGRCFDKSAKNIYFLSTTPPISSYGIFLNGNHNHHAETRIHVPFGCGELYKSAWPGLSDIIVEDSPKDNEIWYTSTEKVIPYDETAFNASILTNEWNAETGKGVITFDKELSQIGMSAFKDQKSMITVTLPNNVASIGRYAFNGCGLTSFIFPTSLTEIGDCALSGCPIETLVCNIESNRLRIIEDDDYSYYTYKGIGVNSKTLNKLEGKYVSNDGKCLVINGTLYAFAGKDIPETYSLPSNITCITSYVMSGLEFKELELNATIYSGAFSTSKIDKLTLSGGYVSERSFNYGTIRELIIKNNVSVGYEAFNCDGESLYIDTSIVDGDWSDDYWPPYYYTRFNKITFGPNVKRIGKNAFNYRIDSVFSLPSTPPTLEWGAFWTDNVYVPTSSVAAYKSAAGWSSYASNIVGYNF